MRRGARRKTRDVLHRETPGERRETCVAESRDGIDERWDSVYRLSCFFVSPRSASILAIAGLAAIALAACGSLGTRVSTGPVARAPEQTSVPPKPAPPRGGGYYLDDGPGDNPPANLDQIPDAMPKRETLVRGTMRPYNVMGRDYSPMTALQPYKVRGIASWYGRRYHGRQTASGEIYDMYAMTAAHTILPIPSYARVTNLANSKSIIVRINDRGPFHSDRLIDLSYTAAYKLGVLGGGRALVDVESINPDAGTPVKPVVAAIPAATPAATATPPVPVAPVAAVPASAAVTLPTEPAAVTGAEAAATTPIVAVTTEQTGGLFLQLGAFGSSENANNYISRLRLQVEWLAPTLHVFPKDGLFRVHAGPYANQAAARSAADRISQALGIRPMVLTR